MGTAPKVGAPLPASVAEAQLLDRTGAARSLSSYVDGKPSVVIFLRHFGCLACAELVSDLSPRLHEFDDLDVTLLFVGNGEAQWIDGFVERNALSGRSFEIATDPSLAVFEAMGLVRSVWGTAGPQAIYGYLKARLRGFPNKRGQGDSYQQGGAVVLDGDGVVRFIHRSRFLGDNADPSDIMATTLTVAAAGRGLV